LRILFFLPLVRQWAFENMIGPLIEKLSPLAEVHIALPEVWLGRYAGPDKPRAVHRFVDVRWHPLDESGVAGPELVRSIDPDYCVCRCADALDATRIPGEIRYIMEASAPPFPVPRHWITLQPRMFGQGSIPELSDREGETLEALISPSWAAIEKSLPSDPDWLERRGIPAGRKVIALPLEYDHPDNLYAIHRTIRPNARLVAAIADRLSPPLFLAVTDHPLNASLNGRDLVDVFEQRKAVARLLPGEDIAGGVTVRLTQHADGMIVGDSKSFAAAAFFGTPMLRLSKFESWPWLHAFRDFDDFCGSLLAGERRGASRADAKRWFAFYLANEAFGPRDAEVDGAEILARLERPVDPARWAAAFQRYSDQPA
jgi:hypothetical protein